MAEKASTVVVAMASTSTTTAAAAASYHHHQPSSSIDKSSDEERRDEEDEEEAEGGGGTSRKVRPAPLDIGAAQRSTGGGPITPTTLRPVHRSSTRNEKERKIGHRRVDEEGQITYKKIQTSQIMGAIQLGISHSIGGLASKPERDVLMQDFAVVETTIFPSQGSNQTPAHHFTDFRFKTYAPVAFRYFRDLFGIQPEDFLLSIANEPMRELTNPGASGSIFYVTADDEFIVKTVQHKEGEFLQKLLPGYYMNLNQNPRTLLPKFFGLYCYQYGGKNVRLCAMNNLLPSDIKIHQKYDLKGSTYKRRAAKHERSKASPTFKDLDFVEHHPEGIFLEAETYGALVKTILRDCRVLASFKIMDYSLLVGIHNRDKAMRERMEQKQSRAQQTDHTEVAGSSDMDGVGIPNSASLTGSLSRSRSIYKQKLVAHSTAMEAIQAESEPVDEEDDVPPGGIPARNAKGERLFLFLGIIDILQSYRFKKKLEHTWKSMLHDGDTVSVHRPEFYAQRFQNFMAQHVFKKVPSLDLPEIKGIHRKFRTLVSSYIALKHSPSRKKSLSRHRPPSGSEEGKLDEHEHQGYPPVFYRNGISRRPNSAVVSAGSYPAPLPPHTSAAFVVKSGSSSVSSPTSQANGADSAPSLSMVVVKSFSSSTSSAGHHHQQQQLPGDPPPNDQPATPTSLTLTSIMSVTGAKMMTQIGSARASKVPPPVPPRSPRKTHNPSPVPSLSHVDIPVSLTPPPTFEEATVDELQANPKARSSTDPNPSTNDSSGVNGNSQGHQRNFSTGNNHTETTSILRVGGMQVECFQSEGSGSLSSGSVVRMWTPPHSVEGSTPTHTEGTPSFTESSSSGDLGCPTTPVKYSGSGRVVMSSVAGASTTSVNSVSTTGSSGPRLYQETEMVSSMLETVTETPPSP